MQIFFIKERIVHVVEANIVSILRCFDPATTLYFFEPGKSKTEPEWDTTTMSIMATLSPELSRYKEFLKNGAKKIFMPLFTEDELLTIGRHMIGRVLKSRIIKTLLRLLLLNLIHRLQRR